MSEWIGRSCEGLHHGDSVHGVCHSHIRCCPLRIHPRNPPCCRLHSYHLYFEGFLFQNLNGRNHGRNPPHPPLYRG